jgi:hypothetical protein
MPTSLKNLVGTKAESLNPSEFHLEKGQIWAYQPNTNQVPNCFCWCPPAGRAGIVVIDMWGAGGSGARMCCCGFGLPGNAGAYVRKSFCISAKQTCCTFVCGVAHHACRESNLCFRGCSGPSQVCYAVGFCGAQNTNNINSFPEAIDTTNFGAGGMGQACSGCDFRYQCHRQFDGCLCAQGGRGGVSMCSTSESAWCCFTCQWFCGTKFNNENCGLICNVQNSHCVLMCGCYARIYPECCYANCYGAPCCVAEMCGGNFRTGPVPHIARGFGGDINCCGHFSCVAFMACNPNNACCITSYIPGPAGMFARDGVVLEVSHEYNNEFSNYSGQGHHQHNFMVSAVSRNPSQGIPWAYCWGFGGGCGCYEDWGCYAYVPPGHGGHNAVFEAGVRDQGGKGGNAAVRIKFIAS